MASVTIHDTTATAKTLKLFSRGKTEGLERKRRIRCTAEPMPFAADLHEIEQSDQAPHPLCGCCARNCTHLPLGRLPRNAGPGRKRSSPAGRTGDGTVPPERAKTAFTGFRARLGPERLLDLRP